MPKKREPIPTGPGACRLCPRWEHSGVVCISGFGPSHPELIVIAESPARVEDTWCRVCERPQTVRCAREVHSRGAPLVGPSGQLLRKILGEVGIDPAQTFFTNTTRCSAGGGPGSNPTMLQVRKCVGAYLLDELAGLDYSRCRGVMLLGETALRGVLNNGRLTLKEARLRVLDSFGPRIGGADRPAAPSVDAVRGPRIDSEGGGNGEIAAPTTQKAQKLPVYANSAQDEEAWSYVIPRHVPLRCSFHPAAALPGRNPGLYDEIFGDFKDLLGQPRVSPNTFVLCRVPTDLDRLFGQAEAIGLDLEWDPDDPSRITAVAVSDGATNAVVESVECLVAWIGGTHDSFPKAS